MKRILAIMLVLCTLFTLTACSDGPLIATATPVPTPTPTPEPTPEPTPTPYFEENVIWPETSLTKLLPHFMPTLEIASQKGDEIFFAAFTEYDPGVINRYCTALQDEMGMTVTTEVGSGLVVATGEIEGIQLKVQIFFDGVSGTIQIVNESLKAE